MGARNQAGAADAVYQFCLAIIGEPNAAAQAASAAFAQAGPWRATLWAHARIEVLRRTPDAVDPGEVVLGDDADVVAVAAGLAATRPPLERVILELRNHTPDRAAFGRALGLGAAEAADRAAAIAESWDSELDPALLAFLGPGDCAELAAVLGHEYLDSDVDDETRAVDSEADRVPSSIADLLAVGPNVAAHAAECETCTDRLRAMVSVRALLRGSVEGDTPATVRLDARRSRVRRPAGFPPGIEAKPDRRRTVVAAMALVAAVLVVSGVGAAVAMSRSDGSGSADRIDALTKVPSDGPALRVTTTKLGDTATAVRIANESRHPIRWRAAPAADWVVVSPASGVVEPGGEAVTVARPAPGSPEGAVQTLMTVTGDDGSAAAAELAWTVERPPEVEVAITSCAVRAAVMEDGDVEQVTLHWRNGTENAQPMSAADEQEWVGELPPSPDPIEWWVSAVDERGNETRTEPQSTPIATLC